jgi:glycosyltransferase involved in cell wall biosynthesis
MSRTHIFVCWGSVTVGRRLGLAGARRLASRWPARSRLMLVADGADWSIAHDMRELGRICDAIGIRRASPRFLNLSSGQAAFFGSQFSLLRSGSEPPPHALATAYFHGRPGTEGMPEFDECFDSLRRLHERVERVQVTHAEMRDLVLSAGVEPAKVHTIRIGVDADAFRLRTPGERAAARASLGVPEAAFAVGSFQKDGVGWGEGRDPKLVKGPDVLVAALELVHAQVPELFVVLSGPARGYVRSALERLGIPYVHRFVRRHGDLRSLYVALDAVAVASRQEGGPKAVLEAMAVGVPVISTRVGQAQELLDGVNGDLVDVGDAESLAAAIVASVDAGGGRIASARATAEANAYGVQAPLWSAFFEGFVKTPT